MAHGRPVELDPHTLPAIRRSREAVATLVASQTVAYGITTGFGRFQDRVISADEAEQLQVNLVRSHAAGVGEDLEETTVRAMLLVRANTLAKGYSGVREEVIEHLIAMLNAGIHPRIPSQGSLGASGDLAPLAHLALCTIGEGLADYKGTRMDAAEALHRAGLQPLRLQAKEGLALLNGTTLMVGLGALSTDRAIRLTKCADIAACMSLEGLHGTARAYDDRVHQLRPHPRQIDCAAYLRRMLDGSELVRENDPTNIQDPYTLRCVPQVHGAVRDSVAYAKWVIDIEMNSVNDNPIIFANEDGGETEVISAGNFHGEPIAMAMDYLKLAITDLGNMSERRIARLIDADSNRGVLPMFLTDNGGLESGFMIAQYSAASLATENKVLAHPASADSIPSSANTEDHVSMGATATRQAQKILDHTETIVAIEILTAAQAMDFRMRTMETQKAGKGTRAAYDLVRSVVPFLEHDDILSTHIEAVRQLVAGGHFCSTVEARIS